MSMRLPTRGWQSNAGCAGRLRVHIVSRQSVPPSWMAASHLNGKWQRPRNRPRFFHSSRRLSRSRSSGTMVVVGIAGLVRRAGDRARRRRRARPHLRHSAPQHAMPARRRTPRHRRSVHACPSRVTPRPLSSLHRAHALGARPRACRHRQHVPTPSTGPTWHTARAECPRPRLRRQRRSIPPVRVKISGDRDCRTASSRRQRRQPGLRHCCSPGRAQSTHLEIRRDARTRHGALAPAAIASHHRPPANSTRARLAQPHHTDTINTNRSTRRRDDGATPRAARNRRSRLVRSFVARRIANGYVRTLTFDTPVAEIAYGRPAYRRQARDFPKLFFHHTL